MKSESAISKVLAVVVAAVVVVAVVAGVLIGISMQPPIQQEVKKLTFQLDWIPGGGNMYFYVAKDMFWPNLGLDITLVRGIGSGDTALKVGQGIADLGYATFDAGANVRAANLLLIKAVFNVKSECDAALYFIDRNNGRGIVDANNLNTLEGKIFANPIYGPVTVQTKAFCLENGINWNAINYTHLDPSAQIPALISGSVDFIGSSIGQMNNIASAVGQALPGYHVGMISLAAHGFRMPADTVWAQDKLIREDPETVRLVVKGIQQAWTWTCEHPMNAAAIAVKYLPEWSGKENILAADFAGDNIGLVNMTQVMEHGAGWMNSVIFNAGLENTYKIYGIADDLHLQSYQDILTNVFVDPTIYPQSVPWT